MKRFYAVMILLAMVSMGNLACKKSDQSNATSAAANNNSTAANKSDNKSETAQPAALDKDKVMSEVLAVGREYLAANDKGDQASLERLLADDFNARWQGKVYDKNGWMEGKTPSDRIATDEIINPVLAGYSADTATLHVDRRITYKDGSTPYTERDSLSFVKKEGHWQLKEHISGH